jgi:hypothetical protein
MQARTYLPAYGKFAQVDPAYDQTKDDPESWNLYNYVTNNPVTKTDPDGRKIVVLRDGRAFASTPGEAQAFKNGDWNGLEIYWEVLPGHTGATNGRTPSAKTLTFQIAQFIDSRFPVVKAIDPLRTVAWENEDDPPPVRFYTGNGLDSVPFGTANDKDYKAIVRATVNTQSGSFVQAPFIDTGRATEVNKAGQVILTGKRDDPRADVSAIVGSLSGGVNLRTSISTSIPLQLAPAFKSEISIKVSGDRNSIQIDGTRTLFPTLEIKVMRDGRVQTLVSERGAASGPGLTTLGAVGDRSMFTYTFVYNAGVGAYVPK